jgi:hypothetical protein
VVEQAKQAKVTVSTLKFVSPTKKNEDECPKTQYAKSNASSVVKQDNLEENCLTDAA